MPQEKSLPIGPSLMGVRHDIPTSYVPPEAAVDTRNMNLGHNVLQKRSGTVLLGAQLPGVPIGYCQYKNYSENLLTLAFTRSNVYKLDGFNNWISIKGLVSWAPNITDYVSHTFSNNKIIATNSSNEIVTWDGSTFANLPNASNYRPTILEHFYDRLIMLNLTESGYLCPQRVRWTRVGTIDDFSGGYAGFADLVDTSGSIVAAKKFGNYLIIYKDDSIVLCSYIGGSGVFGFPTVVLGKGLTAPGGVVDMGTSHLFLSTDNIYEFTGSREPTPVGDPVKDLIVDYSRSEFFYRSLAIRMNEFALFFIPIESDYPDRVFVYNTKTKSWCDWTLSANTTGYYKLGKTLTINDLVGTIGNLGGMIGDFSTVSSTPLVCIGSPSGKIQYLSPLAILDEGVTQVNGYWITGDLVNRDQNGVATNNRYRGLLLDAKGGTLRVEYSTTGGVTWNLVKEKSLTTEYSWNDFRFDVVGDKVRFRFSAIEPVYIRGGQVDFLEGVYRK